MSEAWANFRVQFQSPGTTTIGATIPNECSWEYDYSTGECNCAFYLPVSPQVRTNAVGWKPYAGSLIPIDNGGDGVIAQGTFTLGVGAIGSGASGSRPRRKIRGQPANCAVRVGSGAAALGAIGGCPRIF